MESRHSYPCVCVCVYTVYICLLEYQVNTNKRAFRRKKLGLFYFFPGLRIRIHPVFFVQLDDWIFHWIQFQRWTLLFQPESKYYYFEEKKWHGKKIKDTFYIFESINFLDRRPGYGYLLLMSGSLILLFWDAQRFRRNKDRQNIHEVTGGKEFHTKWQ